MRIDDLNRTPLAQGAEKPEAADLQRSPEKSRGAAGGTDRADVSDLAQALASADPKRIEQLQAAVEAGTYQVPAEALANAIIDAHGGGE